MAKLDYFQDSGSNYDFSDKRIPNQARSSLFDVSYVNTLTAKQGQLIPVWFSYCYPGDTFDVSIDNLIRVVNPPTVPLLSRQRVFFHLFHFDFAQLWDHWDAFMRKGWSANYEIMLPVISTSFATGSIGSPVVNDYLARGSLADFLGFNFSDYDAVDADIRDSVKVNLPAMPFLAYQLIYRDYYLNMPIAYQEAVSTSDSELLSFFPDSDYDLMIRGGTDTTLSFESTDNVSQPVDSIDLGVLRYRDFAPDYFTTSLPYVMRGEVPSLGFSGDNSVGVSIDGDIRQLYATGVLASDNNWYQKLVAGTGTSSWLPTSLDYSFNGQNSIASGVSSSSDAILGGFSTSSTGSGPAMSSPVSPETHPVVVDLESLGVTQIALRQLWTDTLILEKMTRTDGTYGQFLQDFFGQSPSHWTSHRARYIGGSYQPIVYTEVLQTSPGSSGTLGTVGAKGISSASNSLGGFSCTDYGIAMVLMSIMPDTYYSQGWMKEHTYLTQEDFLLPERALLGPQPVTKKELFFNPHSGNENDDLFGYQSRYDELRYRQNEIHGLVADADNASFSPYVQDRRFSTAPKLNMSFLTSKNNIDNSWLTAPDEVAYIVQVANRVTVRRALPYIAPPTAIMM